MKNLYKKVKIECKMVTRPIKKLIQQNIETIISREIIKNESKKIFIKKLKLRLGVLFMIIMKQTSALSVAAERNLKLSLNAKNILRSVLRRKP